MAPHRTDRTPLLQKGETLINYTQDDDGKTMQSRPLNDEEYLRFMLFGIEPLVNFNGVPWVACLTSTRKRYSLKRLLYKETLSRYFDRPTHKTSSPPGIFPQDSVMLATRKQRSAPVWSYIFVLPLLIPPINRPFVLCTN